MAAEFAITPDDRGRTARRAPTARSCWRPSRARRRRARRARRNRPAVPACPRHSPAGTIFPVVLVFPAHPPRLTPLQLCGPLPGDFGGDGFGGRADEELPVLVAVVVGLAPERVRALEMRHHIALHQLDMALCRREVGPVVRELQERAEPAGACCRSSICSIMSSGVPMTAIRFSVRKAIGSSISGGTIGRSRSRGNTAPRAPGRIRHSGRPARASRRYGRA